MISDKIYRVEGVGRKAELIIIYVPYCWNKLGKIRISGNPASIKRLTGKK